MKSTFVITSAIHTKFGVYDPATRLQQTLDTIRSIEKYADPYRIVLLEMGGGGSLTDEEQDELGGNVDILVDYTRDQDLIDLHNNSQNWDVVKNITESTRTSHFWSSCVKDKELLDESDRVFKISGRYRLNENFNPETYANATSKMVVKHRMPSQFDPKITGGIVEQFQTRLWSFDAALLPHVSVMYMDMIKTMIERLNAGGYVDMEHTLFHCMPKELVLEIPTTGVEGNLGPNGALVQD